MVHALLESWRVLAPGGALVDLRPYHANPVLEVLIAGRTYAPGRVDDSGGQADDIAADRAIAEVVRRGCFTQRQKSTFHYADYWESLDGLLAYAEEKWRDFACIPPFVEQAARRCIASGAPYRIRVRRPLHLSVYQKQGP